MPLHVLSTVVLILRRSELYYTASGIIKPVGGMIKFWCFADHAASQYNLSN